MSNMVEQAQVGDILYTIENRNIVELKIVQRVTIETVDGVNEKLYVQNKGIFSVIKRRELTEGTDVFKDKEEAERILDIITRYA